MFLILCAVEGLILFDLRVLRQDNSANTSYVFLVLSSSDKTFLMNQNYWDTLAYKKHDLTNCESEPIAFCGAIQDYGVFIGCDRESGEILAISLNTQDRLGIDATSCLGKQMEVSFVFADGSPFDLKLAQQNSKSAPVLVKVKGQDKIFAASITHNKSLICIDLELYDQSGENSVVFQDRVHNLKHLVHLLDEAEDLEAIMARAAEQIQEITGFERVMIYKFQPNWDGHVIAEALKGDYPPYLDLYYPSSDIPAQARKLYFETKYRMIVDSQALPVPIATKKGIGRSEVDLSCSAFRASSPIHIQYLQNMGVRTSFSLPIKLNGELWGLVSCHGYKEAIKPSRQIRSACELATQVLSGRIADSISERRLRIRNQVFELTQSFLETVTEGQKAISAFRGNGERVLLLTASTGAYVRIGGEEAFLGTCPSGEYIQKMCEKLSGKQSLALWESRSIAQDMDLPFIEEATGAIAVPFSLSFDDLIIWFRPEFTHEVKWGGKPTEQAELVKTLEPRASFAAWSQTVEGKCREWSDADRETAQFMLFTFVQGIFKKAADLSRANVELERATKAKDEFIGMVSHELRTPLGVMIGWIDVLKDYQFRDSEINQALEIIDRNAKLQINLINDLLDVSRIISGKMRINPEPNIDVGAVVADTLNSLLPTAAAKGLSLEKDFDGSYFVAADADRLRQIIWNLISNSIKFTPKGGRVDVQIRSNQSSVEIKVHDTGIGIPPKRLGSVFNRFEQIGADGSRTGGLGLGLSIVRSLVELHGGRVSASSPGEGKGSTFTVVLPIYVLKETVSVVAPVNLREDIRESLRGLHILLAEDQNDSATAMGHLLRRQGASVVIAHSGLEAFSLLKENKFDLLLSDVGMPEWDGYRLISEWRSLEKERGVTEPLPAIALTAYATSQDRTRALQAGFQNHIAKPVDRGELLAVIQSLKMGQFNT